MPTRLARQYRVPFVFVTARRWPIVSPITEAYLTPVRDRAGALSRALLGESTTPTYARSIGDPNAEPLTSPTASTMIIHLRSQIPVEVRMGPAAWVRSEHLQQVSLEQQAMNGLRGSILRGELPPGSRLSIRQAAEAYGTSVMPVRMAVKQLEVEGLVKISPQKYVEVTGLTIDDLMDVNRIRSVLEALAVRLSSEKATKGDPKEREEWLSRARHVFGQLQRADAAEDVTNFVKYHNEFHLILDAHNDNTRLLKEIMKFYDYIAYFREVVFNMPSKRAISMEEHRVILEAVEANDTQLAERITQSHIETLEDHLEEFRKAAPDHEQPAHITYAAPHRS